MNQNKIEKKVFPNHSMTRIIESKPTAHSQDKKQENKIGNRNASKGSKKGLVERSKTSIYRNFSLENKNNSSSTLYKNKDIQFFFLRLLLGNIT